MYRRSSTEQLSFENFYLPFGGKLSGENRWIRLAKLVQRGLNLDTPFKRLKPYLYKSN